jgi:hypothetical protein
VVTERGEEWCDSNWMELQSQVNCPCSFEDFMMGNLTAMTADHVNKNSGHS